MILKMMLTMNNLNMIIATKNKINMMRKTLVTRIILRLLRVILTKMMRKIKKVTFTNE